VDIQVQKDIIILFAFSCSSFRPHIVNLDPLPLRPSDLMLQQAEPGSHIRHTNVKANISLAL